MEKRIAGFDYLRSICVIAVIALHSLDTNPDTKLFAANYLKFPVPLFLILSFFLLFNKVDVRHESIANIWWKRFQRMAPQFIIWTIIYIFTRSLGGNSSVDLSLNAILSYFFFGSISMHLYYIPLLLYFTAILIPVINILKSTKIYQGIFVLSVFSFISALLVFLYSSHHLPLSNTLFAYYAVYNLPYALLGVCIAYYVSSQKGIKSKQCLISLLILFLLFSSIIFYIPLYITGDFQEAFYFSRMTLIESVAFIAFYYCSYPKISCVSWLSKLSFGVYLCHPLFVEGIQHLESKLGLDLSSFNLTIANFFLGCITAIVSSFILSKFKQTRFLVA